MDGNTQEQEIDAMFTKFTDAFSYIRQTFVNANQFAEQVKALQTQVTQLSQDFENLKQHNAALDSAVNSLTSERDTARSEASQWKSEAELKEKARDEAEKNAGEWYQAHTQVSNELASVKGILSERETELQHALDESAKLKEQLERVQAQINQIYQGFAPKPVVEAVQEHSEAQPRDPLTQRWQGWSQTG